jgi:hypothetical protein
LAALACLAACDRPARSVAAPAAPAAARPPPAGAYLAPPALTAARRGPAGVRLEGTAPAGAEVAFAQPSGPGPVARAGPDGRWSVALPVSAKPALFALAARLQGGRVVRAEGAVLVLPEPGPAAMLARAGTAALDLRKGAGAPVITSLDYDSGGGAAVGGLAQPMARVRLSIDGMVAGLGRADENGRFDVIAANGQLAPGERRLQVETETGRTSVVAPVSTAAALGTQAYRATREPGAWRVDWAPAGGGVQTTLVLDAAGAAR